MKPFVINENQVRAYALGAIGALVLSFMLGYVTGIFISGESNSDLALITDENSVIQEEHASGSNQQSVSNEPAKLTQQKQATDESLAKQQIEETAAAEKLAQKKAAEEKAAAEKLAQKKAAEKKAAERKAAERKAAERKAAEKRAAEKKAAEKRAQKLAAEKKAAEEKAAAEKAAADKKAAEKKAAEQAEAERLLAENDTQSMSVTESSGNPSDDTVTSNNKRYYSVQAGMFASKTNAMSFIDELAEKQFEAHVTDFISSSGATKYNVRVGRFEERNQARELLREFQKSFTSPAYVVITQ